MAKSKKQVTTIGNGHGNPILAGSAVTAGGLKQFPPDTGKGQSGTKPLGGGSPESLADGLFRPAIILVQSGDTGTG